MTTFNFYLVKVEKELESALAGYRPKRGFATITFPDCRHDNGKPDIEVYDLRGLGQSQRQFQNWVKREFGYLRHEVRFG